MPGPYVCSQAEKLVGPPTGSGQCVAFVQSCAGAPHHSQWKRGRRVKGDLSIPKGTAIATLDEQGYPNKKHGNHAAIYDSQDKDGIWVYDQWTGQGVHKRQIRFKGGTGSPSDDGDAFYVID